LVASGCNEPASAPAPKPAEDEPEVVIRTVQIGLPAAAAVDQDVSTRYEAKHRESVLEELRQRDKDWTKSESTKTGDIQDRHRDEKEAEEKSKTVLISSLPPDQRPTSPDQFTQIPHLPPTRQYSSGTCWSFATTSMMESEVIRLTKKKIKLSEMSTVYWEYQAKAARYVAERSNSAFGEGSEPNAIPRVWKNNGAMPLDAYPGIVHEDKRHDHKRLSRELTGLTRHFNGKSIWDEEMTKGMLKVVLDRHLGPPPEQFDFEGKQYTPKTFMGDVLQIDPDMYVSIMSTLRTPFYARGEFKVQDNWWHDDGYHNVPLDEFYSALKGALEKGYTVAIGGDVSEPGKDVANDVMFVAPYDIPAQYIDQLAREHRIENGTTTDDHGVHLVGYTNFAGHDWFLAKDSASGAVMGPNKGYFFIRDDYIRLKMLCYTVHIDAVEDVLAKFASLPQGDK
jgi:bleomycin hydrolase